MILHCSHWPNPSRPKVVFLHGMGGTGSLWRPIAASIEDRYDILAPDQRGHGLSQIPHVPGSRFEPSYAPIDYGQDVVETLRSLDFHPAWIVGHSMGVRTACAVAHLAPAFVRGLILVDLGFAGPAGGGLGQGLADFLRDFPMFFASRSSARDYMAAHCPDASIGQYLMAVSRTQTDGALEFPFDKAALLATLDAAKNASVRTWVRALGQGGLPILVLRGALSGVWSEADFEAERMRYADLPSIVFETVARAGHGLPFEQRLDFVARLEHWISLNQHPLPPPIH